MANLIKSDASGFVAENLSPFTIRQMSKIGMVTPSDDTFEEAISNSADIDALLASATQDSPIALGIGDILGVPKFYPERLGGGGESPSPPLVEPPTEPPGEPPLWQPGDGRPPWAPPGGGPL